MLDMEALPEAMNLNDPKDYADCLAQAIHSFINARSDYKIQLLKRLASIYQPVLLRDSDLPGKYRRSVKQAKIRIDPEQFIILVYQIWLTTDDTIELLGAVTKSSDTLLTPPASPVAQTMAVHTSEVLPAQAVLKKHVPIAASKPESTISVWQKFTTAVIQLPIGRALDAPVNTDSSKNLPSMLNETPILPKSMKEKLRDAFNYAGRSNAHREATKSVHFAHMYLVAFIKYDEQKARPNIKNRALMRDIFKDIKCESIILEDFKIIFSNIMTCKEISSEANSIDRELADDKKIALIKILKNAIKLVGLRDENMQERRDLVKLIDEFVEKINEEFRKEEEEKLQQMVEEIRILLNERDIRQGIPIRLMVDTFLEMQQIASVLLNESEQEISAQASQLLLNNKNTLAEMIQSVAAPELKFSYIDKSTVINQLHKDYSFLGGKQWALDDEFARIEGQLQHFQEQVISHLKSKAVELKQALVVDNQEIEKIKPQLTEQDLQLRANKEKQVQLTRETAELHTQIKAVNDLVTGKCSDVIKLVLKLEVNIMENYNKKYTYTKFTRDILEENNFDKRQPEEKLAARWWDGLWFFGIERFCNWCTGTTKQERSDDAIAAIKIYKATADKMRLDEKLYIENERITWLLQDIRKSEPNSKDGKTNHAEYNTKVDEYNEEKLAAEKKSVIALERLDKIKQELEVIQKSNSELAPNKSQTGKKLDELNANVFQNEQQLKAIVESLQKQSQAIADKITLLSDVAQKQTAELLSSLQTTIDCLVKNIESPLQKGPIVAADNQSELPKTMPVLLDHNGENAKRLLL